MQPLSISFFDSVEKRKSLPKSSKSTSTRSSISIPGQSRLIVDGRPLELLTRTHKFVTLRPG